MHGIHQKEHGCGWCTYGVICMLYSVKYTSVCMYSSSEVVFTIIYKTTDINVQLSLTSDMKNEADLKT